MKRLRIECAGPGWQTVVTDLDTGEQIKGALFQATANLRADENWSSVSLEIDDDNTEAFFEDLEDVEIHVKAARRIDVRRIAFDYPTAAGQRRL